MKNLIPYLLLLVVPFLFISCDENDSVSTKPAFFNLKVGNTWVYKEYRNGADPTQFTFSGTVDTVKIVSIENIQGLTFAKKSTKKGNMYNGTVLSNTYTYVRVNNLGHLIEISEGDAALALSETTGLVLHPGVDSSFSFNRIVSFSNDSNGAPIVLGNLEYKLYKPVNMLVEGNNYLVSPYNGVFTPAADHPDLVSKTVEYNYSQNIGLVKSVDHTLSGNGIIEKRLVSYKLN